MHPLLLLSLLLLFKKFCVILKERNTEQVFLDIFICQGWSIFFTWSILHYFFANRPFLLYKVRNMDHGRKINEDYGERLKNRTSPWINFNSNFKDRNDLYLLLQNSISKHRGWLVAFLGRNWASTKFTRCRSMPYGASNNDGHAKIN